MLSTVRCRRAAAATPAAQQQRRNAAAELGLPKSKRAGDSERAQEREVGICVSVPMTSSVRCPKPPPAAAITPTFASSALCRSFAMATARQRKES